MGTPTIAIKGKIIHSQARNIIANVIQFMRQESESGGPLIPLTNFRERVFAATKTSKYSYERIVNEAKEVESGASTSFSSLPKNRPKTTPKSALSFGDKEVIRSTIHNFYITEKRRLTLQAIFQKINDRSVEFSGGLTTFLIQTMGFCSKRAVGIYHPGFSANFDPPSPQPDEVRD
ncbi:hypothetical protein FQA39_LY12289 [Lamprigera yunnana]|nr:hypothetical protein FQA39_LY12289 [Lamprigera yunnana]